MNPIYTYTSDCGTVVNFRRDCAKSCCSGVDGPECHWLVMTPQGDKRLWGLRKEAQAKAKRAAESHDWQVGHKR